MNFSHILTSVSRPAAYAMTAVIATVSLPGIAAASTTVVGKASGQCLDVSGNNTSPGGSMIIWGCNNQSNQQFDFTAAGEIRAQNDTLCLDANGGGTTNGTKVITWTCNGQSNQKWTLQSNGQIVGQASGLCLDVTGASNTQGTGIELWTCNGGGNQNWSQGGGSSSGGGGGGGTTPPGFVFGSYKDVTINMDWNVDQISTSVTGTRSPILNVLPSHQSSASWAFATGECGSESWGGVTPAALVSQNVSQWVNAGKKYIISTGGASGVFTCGSDANFESFIQRYNSSSLQGIDFDIEGGQSQDVINNLVARVKVAKGNHPGLRFSFTLATLGGNASQSLGSIGVTVMNAIKSAGLSGYYINLMAMDYGSAIASNCTLGGNGLCDMGQSAINSAINLHNYWGVPYNQIEVTPMIGGNDATDETFSLSNVDTLSSWAKSNGLAGIHFWSLDRDNDCGAGYASPTCNSYGQAGTWGFTNRFISDLGL